MIAPIPHRAFFQTAALWATLACVLLGCATRASDDIATGLASDAILAPPDTTGVVTGTFDVAPNPPSVTAAGVKTSLVLLPRRYQSTAAAWTEVIDQAQHAKPDYLSVGYLAWRDTEIADGIFDWHEFEAIPPVGQPFIMDAAAPVGFTGDLDVPAHIPFVGFDDLALAGRYLAYLRAAASALPNVAYLIVHTEGVLEYFAAHPDQQAGFCDLLATVFGALKQERPDLKIGAYWRYENNNEPLFLCINQATDIVAVATILNPPADTPASIAPILDRYLALAGDKPLALVEAGYPTTQYLGSSVADQIDFLNQLATVVTAHAPQIAFVAYYSVFDEDRALVQATADTIYGSGPLPQKTALVEWLSSMGLQTEQAVPKASWPVFLQRFGR